MTYKIPNFIKLILSILILEVVVFTIFRIIFFIAFKSYDDTFSQENAIYAFWIGFRFDLQLAIMLLAPLVVFGGLPKVNIFSSNKSKIFWTAYLVLSNFLFTLVYITDFAYFDYFKRRVDGTVFQFAYDLKDGAKMMSEGYPIISTTIIFVLFILFLIFALRMLISHFQNQINIQVTKIKRVAIYTLFVVLITFLGYGKFELYPWRWSEAFFSSNSFLSYLASNPITYFVNTLKNKEIAYDETMSKKYYDDIAQFLEMDKKDPNKLSFARIIQPNHDKEYTFNAPNIIFILGESTAYARTSISGNPLNPTPFLKYMSDNGVSYSRYYTPHSGTARSVFTAMTGLTDVERVRTSSRNPLCVSQNMVLNSMKNYEKFYFIGGSLSWGNVRGVISNVDNIKTYEEHQYKAPHNDVWGISDVEMVGEVNDILKTQKKPFFAFIQLAGNHSPNTIPDKNYGFVHRKNVNKQDLIDYSFDGKLDELNGQAFLDHTVKRLVELAQNENYFKNTVFIFVGDHGLPRKAKHMHKSEQTFEVHTVHTPLIIFSPNQIKHKNIDYPVSEVDIMPTIAGLSGMSYITSAFGRDLLEKDFDSKPHYAFYMTHEENPQINLISKEHILRIKGDGSDKKLFDFYFQKENENIASNKPEIADQMENVCRGIYENTRYTRFNNSSQKVNESLKRMK